MKAQEPQYSILIKALLPGETFDYFEIIKVDVETKVIDVYLGFRIKKKKLRNTDTIILSNLN